jgi:glycosyltransferase involved in cell wall biosynthesis
MKTVLMTADTIGGVWTYALELAEGLARHGVGVALATMGEPLSAAQRSASALENVEVYESRYRLEWMPEPWDDVDRAGEWLLELERELRPDVVHLNGYAHGALPWSAPCLVVAHSCVLSWWEAVKGELAPPEWDEYRRRVEAGVRAADTLVAPTQAMLARVHELYGPLGNGRVIWNARAVCHFAPGAKEPFVVAAGRLGDAAKNIAALGVAARGLAWPVYVAGHQRDASGTDELPAALSSLGHLPPAELAQWLGRASIYALPARYEPFGLSILEAALSGCALVLGDIASLRELWDGAAVFVPPGDPGRLHGALRDLIADEPRRSTLQRAAGERARTFTPERFAAAYFDLYTELLAA